MSPPEHTFPATSLPQEAQLYTKDYKTKSRKLPDLDLKKCELFEMIQYSCDPTLKQEKDPKVKVECEPILRLFRRCGEKGKQFTVETTAWEGPQARKLRRQKAREEEIPLSSKGTVDISRTQLEAKKADATIESYLWSNPTK